MALNMANLGFTLSTMLVGMVGIFLVIGVIIAAVTLLNKLTGGK